MKNQSFSPIKNLPDDIQHMVNLREMDAKTNKEVQYVVGTSNYVCRVWKLGEGGGQVASFSTTNVKIHSLCAHSSGAGSYIILAGENDPQSPVATSAGIATPSRAASGAIISPGSGASGLGDLSRSTVPEIPVSGTDGDGSHQDDSGDDNDDSKVGEMRPPMAGLLQRSSTGSTRSLLRAADPSCSIVIWDWHKDRHAPVGDRKCHEHTTYRPDSESIQMVRAAHMDSIVSLCTADTIYGPVLVSGSEDKCVRLWRLPRGEPLHVTTTRDQTGLLSPPDMSAQKRGSIFPATNSVQQRSPMAAATATAMQENTIWINGSAVPAVLLVPDVESNDRATKEEAQAAMEEAAREAAAAAAAGVRDSTAAAATDASNAVADAAAAAAMPPPPPQATGGSSSSNHCHSNGNSGASAPLPPRAPNSESEHSLSTRVGDRVSLFVQGVQDALAGNTRKQAALAPLKPNTDHHLLFVGTEAGVILCYKIRMDADHQGPKAELSAQHDFAGHVDGINAFAVIEHRRNSPATITVRSADPDAPDGFEAPETLLLSCSEDKTIKMWAMGGGGVLLRTFTGHSGIVQCIHAARAWERATEQVVVSGGWDGNVIVWNPRDGAIMKTIKTASAVVALTSVVDRSQGEDQAYLVHNNDNSVAVRPLKVTESTLRLDRHRVFPDKDHFLVASCALESLGVMAAVVCFTDDRRFELHLLEDGAKGPLQVSRGGGELVYCDEDLAPEERLSPADVLDCPFRLRYGHQKKSGEHLLVVSTYSAVQVYSMTCESAGAGRPFQCGLRLVANYCLETVDVQLCCSGPVFEACPMVLCALPTTVRLFKLTAPRDDDDVIDKSGAPRDFVGSHEVTLQGFVDDSPSLGTVKCITACYSQVPREVTVCLGHDYGAISLTTVVVAAAPGKVKAQGQELGGSAADPAPVVVAARNAVVSQHVVLKGHQGATRCLVAMEVRDDTLPSQPKVTSYLFSGSGDSTIRVWEISSLFKEVAWGRVLESPVIAMCVLPATNHHNAEDGVLAYVCSACKDGIMYTWSFDGSGLTLLRRLIKHTYDVLSLAVMRVHSLDDPNVRFKGDVEESGAGALGPTRKRRDADAQRPRPYYIVSMDQKYLKIWSTELDVIPSLKELTDAFGHDVSCPDDSWKGNKVVDLRLVRGLSSRKVGKAAQGPARPKPKFDSMTLLLNSTTVAASTIAWYAAPLVAEAIRCTVDTDVWHFLDLFLARYPMVLLQPEVRFIDINMEVNSMFKGPDGNPEMKVVAKIVSLLQVALHCEKLAQVRTIIQCWVHLLNHEPQCAYDQINLSSQCMPMDDLKLLAKSNPAEFEDLIVGIKALRAHPVVFGRRNHDTFEIGKDKLLGVMRICDSLGCWGNHFDKLKERQDTETENWNMHDAAMVSAREGMFAACCSEICGCCCTGERFCAYFRLLGIYCSSAWAQTVVLLKVAVEYAMMEREPQKKVRMKQTEGVFVPLLHSADLDLLRTCVDVCDVLQRCSIFYSPTALYSLRYAWKRYGRKNHIIQFYWYFAYVLLFTGGCLGFNLKWRSYAFWVWGYGTQFAVFAATNVCLYQEWCQYGRSKEAGKSLRAYVFGDVWNFFDICGYSFVFMGSFLRILTVPVSMSDPKYTLQTEGNTSRCFMAAAAILLAFKLLYYLRAFDSTGGLVAHIVRCVVAMKYLLVVLFIINVGFAGGFWILYNYTPGSPFRSVDGSLITTFTYMMGSYDPEDLEGVNTNQFARGLYVLFMIVSAVILLNLLIAILQDLYNNVEKHAKAQFRLQQASVLVDNHGNYGSETLIGKPVLIHHLRPAHSKDVLLNAGPDADNAGGSSNRENALLLAELKDKLGSVEGELARVLQLLQGMAKDAEAASGPRTLSRNDSSIGGRTRLGSAGSLGVSGSFSTH